MTTAAEVAAQAGPISILLYAAVGVLGLVIVVLWRAIVRKDKRLSQVHDNQTAALNANTDVLREMKTMLLLRERGQ